MLNKAQQKAVETIDGPLMVIAGPGTGKTELLGMRVANILKTTDTLAENILCLTFTESGVAAMRERLIDIIGKDAYKVAIHTFHSFGNEIIGSYGEYFYHGAQFRPSDELTSREILESIFKDLEHSSLLGSKNDGEYTYLKDTAWVISELKRSGLTSEELVSILDDNELAIQKANQLLAPVFSGRMSIKMIPELRKTLPEIRKSSVKPKLLDLQPLSELIADSLEIALDAAEESNKTTAVTAWRNVWLSLDKKGVHQLKSTVSQAKLREVASIYDKYLNAMQREQLYDFDDMILRVVHAVEIFPELRFNLQEKFQYIMVDEFQDTNLAQMRLVNSLTDSEINGDRPNIMVVGDDDQAIYSFQGADVSNILSFKQHYPKTELITLNENYRSGETILGDSRKVIVQGQNRLEYHMAEVNKKLSAQASRGKGKVSLWQAASADSERHWLLGSIKSLVKSGVKPSDIAVLTRNHKEINELLPYFASNGVDINYERKENILEQPPIDMLYKLAKALRYMASSQHDNLNALLPEILAHPAWSIKPETLLELSLKAYKERKLWIEVMEGMEELTPIKVWLTKLAVDSLTLPLEPLLDELMGVNKFETDDFVSPFYEYYFSRSNQDEKAETYVNYLVGLRLLRRKMRDYKPNDEPTLESFIDFIEAHNKAHIGIQLVNEHAGRTGGVNVMTAHKAKGLEFDIVYIFNATDSTWGESARKASRKISYPENLPLQPAGESDDERLRLFYVAMTRARKELLISYSLSGEGTKSKEKASFLLDLSDNVNIIEPETSTEEIVKRAEIAWYQPLIASEASLKDALKDQLKNYRLSATHLNTFIDVTRGGPQAFLVNNLLRFPQAMTPASAYGSAVHDTLALAHQHLTAKNDRQAIEDILATYETQLKSRHLSKPDFDFYLKKGIDGLKVFLDARYASFSSTQKAELDFRPQMPVIGDAQLTGKIDLVDFLEDRKLHVTDYKTGKAPYSWKSTDANEQVKLHKYRQQLLFYKLMIENSRDYSKTEVSQASLLFVEPTSHREISELTIDFDREELDRTRMLIEAVWKRIIDLDMPDISGYSKSIKGVRDFENDLIENIV